MFAAVVKHLLRGIGGCKVYAQSLHLRLQARTEVRRRLRQLFLLVADEEKTVPVVTRQLLGIVPAYA